MTGRALTPEQAERLRLAISRMEPATAKTFSALDPVIAYALLRARHAASAKAARRAAEMGTTPAELERREAAELARKREAMERKMAAARAAAAAERLEAGLANRGKR